MRQRSILLEDRGQPHGCLLCQVPRRQSAASRARFDWRGHFLQRISEVLPSVIAAQQWSHVADAEPPKLQRRTGAGGFVRSGTEQDDFTIPRDFAVASLQFFRRNPERARQSARVRQQVKRVAQIDNRHRLAGIQLPLEFFGSDAQAGYLLQEAAALIELVRDISTNSAYYQQQCP